MRIVVAAAVCGLTVFVSLIAQDGPETTVSTFPLSSSHTPRHARTT